MINAPCNLSISVTAIGTGLTYQWEKDGGIISGATFATYSKNPTVASDAGKYVCKVTGTCGMVASKEINVFTGESEDGVLTDSRDGQTYRVCVIIIYSQPILAVLFKIKSLRGIGEFALPVRSRVRVIYITGKQQ